MVSKSDVFSLQFKDRIVIIYDTLLTTARLIQLLNVEITMYIIYLSDNTETNVRPLDPSSVTRGSKRPKLTNYVIIVGAGARC